MASEVVDHPYREFERAGWERAAGSYAASFEAATGLFAPALLEAVQAGPQTVLLDVACGPGPVTALAAALGAQASGVDFSPAMIAEATRRNPALSFRVADAEALPFADRSFDAVVVNFGVHHFPFPQRALSEAYRVLRSGGRLAFTTWAAPSEHVIHRIVLEAVRGAGDAGAALPLPPGGPINENATCQRLLREAGFAAGSLHTETLHRRLPVESADRLVALLESGTVRLSATLRSQGPQQRAAVLAAIEAAVAQYLSKEGLRIPFVAILASASKL